MDERIEAFECPNCDYIGPDSGGVLYECESCSLRFTKDDSADGASNRCPECSRFAAKVANESCPECCESEVEEMLAWHCDDCDEWGRMGDAHECEMAREEEK